jgi:hypothetical protein
MGSSEVVRGLTRNLPGTGTPPACRGKGPRMMPSAAIDSPGNASRKPSKERNEGPCRGPLDLILILILVHHGGESR